MTKVKLQYLGDLTTECIHVESKTKMIIDAPKDIGGKGSSFSPSDLIGAALGSCILITMGNAAKRCGFVFDGTTAEIEKEMITAPKRCIGKIIVRLRCPQMPSPPIQEKLEKAAGECVVQASLHPNIKKEIDFIWGI